MMASNIVFVHRFLTSLFFTDAIETLVLILLLRAVFKNRTELSRLIFAGLYASFSTIAYVWFVFPYLMYWPASVAIGFAEVFAFTVEAVLYRFVLRLSWKVAFFVSFACNLVSYMLGPILRAHGLWITW